MERFFSWMQEIKERQGQREGTIALWIRQEGEVHSYTLILSKKGIQVKEPGLRTADLILSMREGFFNTWLDGELDPNNVAPKDFAWEGDTRLLKDLGFRMSNAPMLPHQTQLQSDDY